MEIYSIKYADASEIKTIIEELYGTAESNTSPSGDEPLRVGPRPPGRPRRSSSSHTAEPRPPSPPTRSPRARRAKHIDEGHSADERTNSAHRARQPRGPQGDRRPASRRSTSTRWGSTKVSKIYVVYLENAKAEEVASSAARAALPGRRLELAAATPGERAGRNRPTRGTPGPTRGTRRAAAADQRGGPQRVRRRSACAIAAFDSGMRIAADENTNSLVIIANPKDFETVSLRRDRASSTSSAARCSSTPPSWSCHERGHLPASGWRLPPPDPVPPRDVTVGLHRWAATAPTSLGLTQDALSGLAVRGVRPAGVDVPVLDPVGGVVHERSMCRPSASCSTPCAATSGSVNIVSATRP